MSNQHPRRRFLAAATGSALLSLAGCASLGGGDVKDSDGDGVIDSQDYAPKDPDVQAKSDIESKGKVSTSTSTAGPTATSTTTGVTGKTTTPATVTTETTTTDIATATPTPTATTTATPSVGRTNQLEVSGLTNTSHVSAYSLQSVTATLYADDVNFEGYDVSEMELAVLFGGFPDGRLYGRGRSDETADANADTQLTASVDVDDVPTGTPVYHAAFLIDRGVEFADATADDVIHLHETDPFVLDDDYETISRARIDELDALDDDAGEHYTRTLEEGMVSLELAGRSQGSAWQTTFFVYKSAYVEARRRDHGRARPEFVTYEMSSGFATDLADILDGAAERNGITGKREKVEFVIDAVQRLPYVPDDVSRGFDDITKYSAETLVEGGGDCEDTSIMLASVLQSEPFGYDMILIQPPGHMAVGILGADDLPGTYWTLDGGRYYYIETTGVGWGIGDLPDEYRDAEAYLHQV